MTTDETRIEQTPLLDDGRQPGRARALVLIIVLLLFVGLAASLLPWDADPGDEQATPAGAVAPGGDAPSVPTTVADPEADDPSIGEVPAEPAGPSDGPPPADPPPAEPPAEDPVPEPTDPCDSRAEGHTLVVTPDPLELDDGDMAGDVVVRNCGDEPVEWTAQTVPHVALQMADGTLAGGAEVDLQFAVDADEIDGGPFHFKIKVSEPGASTYVDVEGYEPLTKLGP